MQRPRRLPSGRGGPHFKCSAKVFGLVVELPTLLIRAYSMFCVVVVFLEQLVVHSTLERFLGLVSPLAASLVKDVGKRADLRCELPVVVVQL